MEIMIKRAVFPTNNMKWSSSRVRKEATRVVVISRQRSSRLQLMKCKAANTGIIKVDEVLHMEGGQGEDSYANNSFVQKRIITKTRPILEETMKELCQTILPITKCMTIAELGCSSGPNALEAIWEIIKVTASTFATNKNYGSVPEYEVFLNDLIGNDFNSLFKLLPEFQKKIKELKLGANCFVSGAPGSFHGRLFPTNFLHFVHATSSVHFLSQVPKGLGVINKGSICITKQSPSKVYEAYYQQFVDDFTLFLRSRATEVVSGGRMVLTFRGSITSDKPEYLWDFELLGSALHSMVLEGMIEEEKLDSFNVPFYTPSVEEVRRLIEEQGSFAIDKLETFTVDWGLKDTDLKLTLPTRAKIVGDGYRAATGPILASQFGVTLMDDLFHRFEEMAMDRLRVGRLEILNFVISMTRK